MDIQELMYIVVVRIMVLYVIRHLEVGCTKIVYLVAQQPNYSCVELFVPTILTTTTLVCMAQQDYVFGGTVHVKSTNRY